MEAWQRLASGSEAVSETPLLRWAWAGRSVVSTVFSFPASGMSQATALTLHLQGGDPTAWRTVILLGTCVLGPAVLCRQEAS